MSDWNGPNVYRVESYVDKTKHISLSSGKSEDGTAINIWPQNPYNLWEFAYVGLDKSGKHEYLMLNTYSGTYLTAKDLGKHNHMTGNTLSPGDPRVRWHVIPTCSGNGTYWITPAADTTRRLGLSNRDTKQGTQVDAWNATDAEKECWWYLRLADGAKR